MVITVSCPSCSASFPVDSNKIPEAGVNARCSSCGHVFRIERPQEEAPVAEFQEVAAPPVEAMPEPEPEPTPEPEPEPEPLPSFEEPVFEAPAEAEADAGLDPAAETDFSIGEPAAETDEAAGEDWVFETEEQIDPGSLDIEPIETVESSVAQARDESAFFGSAPAVQEEEATEEPAAPAEPDFSMDVAPEVSEPAEEAPAPEAPAVTGFTFGKRDPKEKARRLARVLVSDMIMYNPERHERALANGTLREDFEDEIAKSWKEYVEQVGEDMANDNPFWAEALNDVLAKGEQLF